MGTNGVENNAAAIERDGKRRNGKVKKRNIKMILTIMRDKLEDAEKDRRIITNKYYKQKDKMYRTIPRSSYVAIEFRRISWNEASYQWELKKKKNKNKIKHLTEKHSDKPKLQDYYHGVKISDKAIGPTRVVLEPTPYNINQQEVTTEMKEAMRLPPKFNIPKRIILEDVKTEIEKCFVKARMSQRKKAEREERGLTEEEYDKEECESHVPYNPDTRTLDLRKVRTTDLPTNGQFTIPSYLSNGTETQIAALGDRLIQTTKSYLQEKCDNKGNIKDSQNLTKAEGTGLREIQNKIKAGDYVSFTTDKSQKISISSKEGYVRDAQPHIQDDDIITPRELHQLEREMNAHTFQLCRVFQVCKTSDTSKGKRTKEAMTNTNLAPPPLYFCHKDHKPIPPGENSPPVRPICGCIESHNGQISYILSTILTEIANRMNETIKTECESTQEMIYRIDESNRTNRIQTTNSTYIIGSLDVKALYPSLEVEATTELVREAVLASDINFSGINWRHACLYLALTLPEEEKERPPFKDILPRRKNTRGRRPGITTAEVMGPLFEERESLYGPLPRQLSEEERKIVLAKVIKQATYTAMKNHTYRFGGDIRKQREGGPIGLTLSGTLARIVMLWWDKQFLEKCKTNHIEVSLYQRYVDDINIKIKEIKPAAESDNIDSQQPKDVRSMKEIRKIANTIVQMIQVEEDCPSLHEDGKLPILDLKVWIGEEHQVMYEYYRKPISNPLLLLQRSAMPDKMKRTVLTQEAIRILRNCSKELAWDRKAELLSQFTERMKDSGYNQQFRLEIITSAIKGFERMVEEERRGGRPINPPREWNETERRIKKMTKKVNWYKRGGYSAVMFVPWTPHSELIRRFRSIEASGAAHRGFRIKMVERCGASIKSVLQKSDPWNGDCNRERCFPCRSGNIGKCNKTNIVYKIDCLECMERGPTSYPQTRENGTEVISITEYDMATRQSSQRATYWGETSRNGYTRGKEHLEALDSKDTKNALWKHCMQYHLGNRTNFKMKITNSFRDPLTRLVNEGVNIVAENQDILMNSKSEFRQGAVGQTSTRRGLV